MSSFKLFLQEKDKEGDVDFHLVQGRMKLQAIETEAVRRQLVEIQQAYQREKLALQRGNAI